MEATYTQCKQLKDLHGDTYRQVLIDVAVESWSGFASRLLSIAVEVWCNQFDLDGVNWD